MSQAGFLSQTGSSDVTGPGSSTDRAFATWSGTNGTALRDNPTSTINSNGDPQFTIATAGATRTLNVAHSDNTNTASNASINSSVGGASGGDAMFKALVNGGQTWTWGCDNSDSDAWGLVAGAALGTANTCIHITTGGEINYPRQPAFLGMLTVSDASVTGDGTAFVMGSGNAFNEIFDQNGDWNNTTATFVAPVTGRYCFNVGIGVSGITAGHTNGTLTITTSNRNYQVFLNLASAATPGGTYNFSQTCFADMDAADTCTITIQVNNGAKVITVTGGGGAQTRMSGWLVA